METSEQLLEQILQKLDLEIKKKIKPLRRGTIEIN